MAWRHAGQEKTPPILPFTTPMESDQRLRGCQRDAAGLDERFYPRIRPGDDVFGTDRKASSASWWLWRVRRQTPQTIGPCRAQAL